jgi:hypothetical protein
MWMWVAVGAAAFAALSLLVGLVVAAVLGTISREISELYELDYWTTWHSPRVR